MIIVIPVIDSEGQAWKSGDRDIPQPRFPEVGNIRIEDIPEPGFGECECASDALCKYCCSGSRWERIRLWMEKRVAEISLGEHAMIFPESCSFVRES